MNALTYPFEKDDCVDCTNLSGWQVQLILNRMWELGARKGEDLECRCEEFQFLRWESPSSRTFFADSASIYYRPVTWEQIMEHENSQFKNSKEVDQHGERKNEKENSVGKLIDRLLNAIADSSIKISVDSDGETLLSSRHIEEINAGLLNAEEINELLKAMMLIEKRVSEGVKGE